MGASIPKHCEAPPPPGNDVRLNFGYGGYQEARVSAAARLLLRLIDLARAFFFLSVRPQPPTPLLAYLAGLLLCLTFSFTSSRQHLTSLYLPHLRRY